MILDFLKSEKGTHREFKRGILVIKRAQQTPACKFYLINENPDVFKFCMLYIDLIESIFSNSVAICSLNELIHSPMICYSIILFQ
jgi:hypothetical protein